MGLGGRGAGNCQGLVLTLLGGKGVGGRADTRLGEGRSITFVGTQCRSKVKSGLVFLSWHDLNIKILCKSTFCEESMK